VENSERLAADLRRHTTIGLDTSVIIYHLEDVSPHADLTQVAFTLLAQGAFRAAVSMISVTELLVKPFAAGNEQAVTVCEHFLQKMPNATLVAPNYEIAKEAARLRGLYRLRTPDALLLSTALAAGAGAFLTNDAALKRVEEEGIEVFLLDNYLESTASG